MANIFNRIFYDIYSAGSALLTTFVTPSANQMAVNNGTNIPLSAAAKGCSRIRVLTMATLLAESVRRVNNEESISALFD